MQSYLQKKVVDIKRYKKLTAHMCAPLQRTSKAKRKKKRNTSEVRTVNINQQSHLRQTKKKQKGIGVSWPSCMEWRVNSFTIKQTEV